MDATLERSPASATDGLRLAGTLLLLVRTLDQHLRATSTQVPWSIAELSVLGQVEHGLDRPSLLARTLRLDPARVTHLTDRLVALGYLDRALDRSDRRRWRLSLTTAGTERLAEGRVAILEVMDGVLGGLSVSERAGLIEGLAGVRRSLDVTMASKVS